MKNYDIIIIGSGLSGLVCGSLLSKDGLAVCVLEKNNQLGGCLQTFKRRDVEFDTGVHYIGSLGNGEYLYNIFKYLGIMDKVTFKKMDEDCFDKIYLNGKEYFYSMGFEKFADQMKTYFPNNSSDIDLYISQIQNKVKSLNLLHLKEINNTEIIEPILTDISINEFLNKITTNKELQNVLAGTNTLYAGLPDRTSAFTHSIINHSYIQSAWRTVGGSQSIADALKQNITDNGGTVLNNHEVIKLHLSDSEIKAVEIKNGELMHAKTIISSIHPTVLLGMIELGKFRKTYVQRVQKMKNSISCFTVYFKFKKDTFKFLNYNLYGFRDDNVWDTYHYNENSWPGSYMFMTPPFSLNDRYAKSAIVVTLMRYDEVKSWQNTVVGKRGKEYIEFKRKKAELIINILDEKYPGFKNCIEEYYTSSPLTYRDYTATKEGAIYGITRDCRQPFSTFIPPRTKISNLLLTGQNINLHGVLGVTIGSIITCGEILGINNISKKIRENC